MQKQDFNNNKKVLTNSLPICSQLDTILEITPVEQMSKMSLIYIQNLNGNLNIINQDKIYKYVKMICKNINAEYLDAMKLAKSVYPKLKEINTIKEFEDLIISCAAELAPIHCDYPKISVYILVKNLHKGTNSDYVNVAEQMRNNINIKGREAPIIKEEFLIFVRENGNVLNKIIKHERDYDINFFGYSTLNNSYLKELSNKTKVERPQQLWLRVSIAMHFRTPHLNLNERLAKIKESYDLLSEGYFVHATPTLFNAGAVYEQLSSCFLLGIDDSMEGVGECLKDCGLLSKHAGGIGIGVSNIRASGSYIHSTQGTSSGMKVLSVFNSIASYSNQGGKRNGSIAIYLEPWHMDIEYFLDLKKPNGSESERTRDLFFGLMINDIFMVRVEEDKMWSLFCPNECPKLLNKYGKEFNDVYEEYEKQEKYGKQIKARDLMFKIMETQIETGLPYMSYKDAVNSKSNQINIGVINNSNLCVSGNTMILTDKGYIKIKSVVGEKVNIWNGDEFSKSKIMKTGINQKMMEITFSNGSILECTEYHKFHLTIDYSGKSIVKQTNELKIGDKLIKNKFPIIDYGFDIITSKYEIPLNSNIKIKLDWLTNLIDDNGIIVDNFLQINSTIPEFLNNLKYMLQTMGCNPYVISNKLLLNHDDIYTLINLGLETNSLDLSDINRSQQDIKQFIIVKKIEYLKNTQDTYCFNEPKKHMGIFNGIITGNCNEISIYSTPDEYAVCNLTSICLPKLVQLIDGKYVFNYQKLYEIARVTQRNLDNLIDINYYPVNKAKNSNLKHRPTGTGVQGLADVFALFRTPFDSDLARDINKKIFETIYFGCMTESMTIAKERTLRGEQETYYSTYLGSPISKGLFQFNLWNLPEEKLSGMWDWKSLRTEILKYGVRNSLTTCVPPTASTSQIMGNNEAVEAYTCNIYARSTLAGEFYVVNKHLIKHLIELNLWDENMVDLIKYYEGSIQNIVGIPDDVKLIYRTVFEIPQQSIIEMSGDRAPFIDQTQSLNLHFDKPNNQILLSSHFYGWKLGLKTGMYYCRTKPSSEANKFGIDLEKIREIEHINNLKSIIDDHINIKEDSDEEMVECIPRYDIIKKEMVCDMCSS